MLVGSNHYLRIGGGLVSSFLKIMCTQILPPSYCAHSKAPLPGWKLTVQQRWAVPDGPGSDSNSDSNRDSNLAF